MNDTFALIRSLVPEVDDLLPMRLRLLQLVNNTQEVRAGRKFLAQQLNLTERTVRTVLETLKDQQLVTVDRQGVKITARGRRLLEAVDDSLLSQPSYRYYELEQALKQKLGIKHCQIVPGDGDSDSTVYHSLGKAVQAILANYLPEGDNLIAVTGGSTLAKVAKEFTPELSKDRKLTFLPSRGGLGSSITIQSNSVGSQMAQRTDSKYIPLFMPENLTKETSQMLMQDPHIKQLIEMGKHANCLLLSVGTAKVMAERRDIDANQQEIIENGHAVGEAFGIFFDAKGETVLRYPRIGLKFKDLEQIPLLITIVGGSSKAEAVEAFFQRAPSHSWLVCDEGVATKVLNGVTL